ncbi:MAG: energy coupling factor transporter S component ThiW [Acidaminococcus sp.]|jgi:energy coupling factor transporter S component ThiW|nr:energy coupling factor transporter S component ThiW [Acidaminococcus sp.]MCI2100371.1 energy coupling factor transporter S component ThiW [Acidaminococcus sp.]MCI2114692.1 energy coupling factor transporter S component ThiW [Acidaminococcus sp.]MCI2116733.1 energy coupling factor transporter S component ThiW [Acidaminococcus sp.]
MSTYRLTLSAIFIAIGTLTANLFYIPVGVSKCFPMQNMIDALTGALMGPANATIIAFLISLLRNLLGTGSPLAFPGSMIGAFLAGILYKRFRKIPAAMFGELFGTGIIGAWISAFISSYLLGKDVPFYFFVAPFLLSSGGGVILAGILLKTPFIQAIGKKLAETDEKH